MKFFIGDPKKGGKEVSFWEYLEQSGLIDYFEERGTTINPTYNFELLKAKRLELFEREKESFLQERDLNNLKTEDFELNCFYIAWLRNELNVIKKWFSKEQPNGEEKTIKPSTSTQIELLKYSQFIDTEIEITENKINPPKGNEAIVIKDIIPANDTKKLSPEEELEILFYHNGNIELFNMLKEFINKTMKQNSNEIEKVMTKEQFINFVALKHLNTIIFPVLEAVYLFNKEPFKCISWIKGKLKQFETSYAEFLKSLLVIGLKDPKRFNVESDNVQFITQQISNFNCSQLKNEASISIGMFEYFTGNNSYSEIKQVLEGNAAVRGFLKTKKDIVKDFINDNREEIIEQLKSETKPIKSLLSQLNSQVSKRLIIFKDTETITKIHNELKGYFPDKESELLKALNGEKIAELILFPHNQNKWVEVFKRLKYNGYLLSTPIEIENWICTNFSYQYKKGVIKEVRNFNKSTVHDILTKDKGEPKKNERICVPEWLPYKSYLTRQRDAENEEI